MIRNIYVTEKTKKQLQKSPPQVRTKFKLWESSVNNHGIAEVRKRPGWHDEPLQGDRKGQRSIRLNRQWRAIYVEKIDGNIEFIEVQEVMPHDY